MTVWEGSYSSAASAALKLSFLKQIRIAPSSPLAFPLFFPAYPLLVLPQLRPGPIYSVSSLSSHNLIARSPRVCVANLPCEAIMSAQSSLGRSFLVSYVWPAPERDPGFLEHLGGTFRGGVCSLQKAPWSPLAATPAPNLRRQICSPAAKFTTVTFPRSRHPGEIGTAKPAPQARLSATASLVLVFSLCRGSQRWDGRGKGREVAKEPNTSRNSCASWGNLP